MKFFLIDEKKLIILWSAKCGCTSLKMILNKYYNYVPKPIHGGELDKNYQIFDIQGRQLNESPEIQFKFKTYKICLLYRNPYDRLVSGFINKYVDNYPMYKTSTEWNTFEDFVNILYNNPEEIDFHHFTKQTSEIGWYFYKKTNKPKITLFYSVNEVNNICNLLDIPIFDPRQLFLSDFPIKYQKKRNNRILYNDNTSLYNIPHNQLKQIIKKYKFNNYQLFYNDNITTMVNHIYKDDFIFFNENNIHFTKY